MKFFGCAWLIVIALLCATSGGQAQTSVVNSDALYHELNGVDRSTHREWRQTVGTRPAVFPLDYLKAKYDLEPRNHDCPVYFGQANARPLFTELGTFSGVTLIEVAAKLKSGELAPDDLPIQFVWIDGKRVTVNNRSLAALYLAEMRPSQLIDLTRHPGEEKASDTAVTVLQRLEGMASRPSTEMLVRSNGLNTAGELKSAAEWDAPIGQIVSMPEDLLLEAQSCQSQGRR